MFIYFLCTKSFSQFWSTVLLTDLALVCELFHWKSKKKKFSTSLFISYWENIGWVLLISSLWTKPHKLAKKEQDQYSPPWTIQASSGRFSIIMAFQTIADKLEESDLEKLIHKWSISSWVLYKVWTTGLSQSFEVGEFIVRGGRSYCHYFCKESDK